MEWEEPAIILATAPQGEGDLLATLLTPRGAWRGLARGGAARARIAIWQPGNLLAARWAARLPEQLGSFTGELVHPAAALAMAARTPLAVLTAACALAAGALPEREPHPQSFAALTRLLAGIDIPGLALPALIRWELALLRELGFGLDFSPAAGANDQLAYVSPRTGRAVTLSQAGEWRDRLLALPTFLLDETEAEPDLPACLDGLKLTGHFLARDVFGARHLPLPTPRARLYDLIADQATGRILAGDDDAR
ncbi:MAG: DNA repair protein RecO [Acidocella sp.]|nr:DNA repair protein RecO [Acidocella sp.]